MATDDVKDSRIRPSLFHGAWDGCEMEIEFDPDTVEDLIVHDVTESIYTKFSENFVNGLGNGEYVLD